MESNLETHAVTLTSVVLQAEPIDLAPPPTNDHVKPPTIVTIRTIFPEGRRNELRTFTRTKVYMEGESYSSKVPEIAVVRGHDLSINH